MQNIIQPWLSVGNSKEALAFYKLAFDAVETYKLDTDDESVVARLSINGATFWISDASPELESISPASAGGSTVKLVLITPDPEQLFDKAIRAGAEQIFPIGEQHSWKLGRIKDPFGHHWEIGYELQKEE